jgi:hypothetical protein
MAGIYGAAATLAGDHCGQPGIAAGPSLAKKPTDRPGNRLIRLFDLASHEKSSSIANASFRKVDDPATSSDPPALTGNQPAGRMLRMVPTTSNPARALPSSAALAGSGAAPGPGPARTPMMSVKFWFSPVPHVHS